jgi:LA2681-like HEPN
MTEPSPTIEVNIEGLPDSEALKQIGLLIDAAHVAQSACGADRTFTLLDELQQRDLTSETAALAHYFRANAWENRRLARTDREVWGWEQAEHQEQILELRRAVSHKGFKRLDAIRQCQILTNLANQLNTIGRFIEAIELWDRALSLSPQFGMALGNRGQGLSSYAKALYDHGHGRLMLVVAHDALCAASAEDAFYETPYYASARSHFESLRKQIAASIDIAEIHRKGNLRRHSLGRGAKERRYRKWCLYNRLFINPLNDLGPLPIAARDVMTLPSITESSPSPYPPAIIGFFNQMKQEFVSARYLYYEGAHAGAMHFSDRDVQQYNTLDYPVYSHAAEKMRAAFRLSYSLLDKIAFFINDYLAVGHNRNQVSFRSVWCEARGPKPWPLHQRFSTYQNWPLRGLYWLSKDFFEDDFQQVTEPDAADLKKMRDHLEHKYLHLHDSMGMARHSIEPDRLGYALSRDDFAARTLRLLKRARAALIHLSLAVYREERRRESEHGNDPAASMMLDRWRDEWKR